MLYSIHICIVLTRKEKIVSFANIEFTREQTLLHLTIHAFRFYKEKRKRWWMDSMKYRFACLKFNKNLLNISVLTLNLYLVNKTFLKWNETSRCKRLPQTGMKKGGFLILLQWKYIQSIFRFPVCKEISKLGIRNSALLQNLFYWLEAVMDSYISCRLSEFHSFVFLRNTIYLVWAQEATRSRHIMLTYTCNGILIISLLHKL